MTTAAGPLGARAAAADAVALDRVVRELAFGSKERLFPGEAAVEILAVELGPARHRRWGSHHRGLKIRYERAGQPGALDLWLKFRPGVDALFPLLDAYDRRLDRPVFPRPYFAWRDASGDCAFLATAHVAGVLLRDRLLRLAALRQTARLEAVLRSNGVKMRLFHDAFAAEHATPVAATVADLAGVVRATPLLDDGEREAVAAHLRAAAEQLGLASLPAIRTHDDWVLRNIIIAPDGTDYVIDAGGLQAPPKWRWYDIGLFLLNLDFQLKWTPLATRPMLTRLWRAFWEGYSGDAGPPDGLRPEQAAAVLYLVRLRWLLDGVVRRPYLELTRSGRLNERLSRRLRQAIVNGRCAVLDC